MTSDVPARRLFGGPRAGVLVIAVAFALFAPTLVFQQVGYDDPWLWSEDSPLRDPGFDVLHKVFFDLDARSRHDLGTEYLPVRDLVVAADMAIWGTNQRGPHSTQLALYLLTVLGLGRLLIGFGLRREVAWLATLLWAIHPLHVESVAWLSERKGVLAGLFVIACGHAWLRYRREGKWWWLLLSAIAAIAGVWSKAPAMFGPVAIAAWDVLLLPQPRRRWMAIASVGTATVLAAIPVVIVAIDGRIISSAASDSSRWLRAIGAHGHYVQGLVLANKPSLSYPIQTDGASALTLAVGGLAIVGLLTLGWWARRHDRRWYLAAIVWTAVWFVPVSHLIMPVHIVVADRFVYFWVLGGCLAIAWLVDLTNGPVRLAITGVLIATLGISTIRAEQAWTSSFELFSKAFTANPRDANACENLAGELFKEGMQEEALAILDEGLSRQPEHPYLSSRKAGFLHAMGRTADARAWAHIAARSGRASTMVLYAELLLHSGAVVEALVWAEAAVRRRPENHAYARLQITLLLRLGYLDSAHMVARELLARDPQPGAHLLLVEVLLANRRFSEAQLHWNLAVLQGSTGDHLDALRGRIRQRR